MDRKTYADRVLSGMKRVTARERRAIRQELEGHIEDHMEGLLELGWDETLAEERTLAAMGDPAEVGRALDREYPLRWLVLGRMAMVLTLLLALLLARPLAERLPTAWESLQVRWAPKTVLDMSQVREDFDPLGLDAWDTDAEAVIRDVHFRVYQAAFQGEVRLAVACWRTNPFREPLERQDGCSCRIQVDGEETGYSIQPGGSVDLYALRALPGQTLTMTWEVYGETGTAVLPLPEE